MVVDVSSQYYPAHPVGKLRSLLFMVISDRLRPRPLDSGPTILLQHPPVKSRRITAKRPSSVGRAAHANNTFQLVLAWSGWVSANRLNAVVWILRETQKHICKRVIPELDRVAF